MKVSFKTDYACKAVLDICIHGKNSESVPVADISRRQDIPLKYLEQILSALKKNNIIISRRGKGGGYIPARDSSEIMLGEVVEAIEGPIRPITCYGEGAARCSYEKECPFQDVWKKLEKTERSLLYGISMKELEKERRNKLRDSEPMYYI